MIIDNYSDNANFINIKIDLTKAGNVLPDGSRFIDITYDGLSLSIDKFSMSVPLTVVLNGTDPAGPNTQIMLAGDSLLGRFSQARIIYPPIAAYPRGIVTVKVSKNSFINNTNVSPVGVQLATGQISIASGLTTNNRTYAPAVRSLITNVCLLPSTGYSYAAADYTHANIRCGKSFTLADNIAAFDVIPVEISAGVFDSFPQNFFTKSMSPVTVEAGETFSILTELTRAITSQFKVDYFIMGHQL